LVIYSASIPHIKKGIILYRRKICENNYSLIKASNGKIHFTNAWSSLTELGFELMTSSDYGAGYRHLNVMTEDFGNFFCHFALDNSGKGKTE